MNKNTHFIGIGGIGMSGLARLLLEQNQAVTGSDSALNTTIQELIRLGAVIHEGHSAVNIPPSSRVVYSSGISKDNPEYEAAIRNGYPLLHRADLLAELLQGHRALAVAGTHGKTTTSSLLATVLVESGEDPSFAIGGILPAYQSNARSGKGAYFVLEADESDGSFIKYHPYGAIVTNINHDHLVNYEGSKKLQEEAFQSFISQVSSTEHLFWNGDDPNLRGMKVPGFSYGFHEDCSWRITAWEQQGFHTFFDMHHAGKDYQKIELSLTGAHNVWNGAAVFGLSIQLGIPEEKIREAFKQFKGVLRRCEFKGEYGGISFIDDYAHHPTEIQATLKGIRKAIVQKRMIAVYQPHRYTRVQECAGLFGPIFKDADELIITDIYSAGEPPIAGIDVEMIVREVQAVSSLSCKYVPRAELSHYLCRKARSGDVLVTLGAGDLTRLAPETLNLMKENTCH